MNNTFLTCCIEVANLQSRVSFFRKCHLQRPYIWRRRHAQRNRLPSQYPRTLPSIVEYPTDIRSSFMDFQIAELPGHVNYFTPDFNQANIFSEIGAVIWVIDAQDQYLDALSQLIDTITYLAESWPAINVEVFVHKVDGLSEEYKNDTFRDIRQRILDELSDFGYDNAPVSFYQTSIYDHSVFESISKVIQKLLPQLPTLESLLNSLCSTCRIQKAYLFDIITKIYIASDTSPQDTNSYEISSDLIDVVVDISELYGWPRPRDEQDRTEFGNHACESMITMEKKGHNYLYLREMNRYGFKRPCSVLSG